MPEIAIYSKRQHEQFSLSPGVWMLGSGEQTLGAAGAATRGRARLVIRDPDLPKDQLQLDVREEGTIRLSNLGRSMTMEGGRRVRQGEEVTLTLPTRLFVAGA